MWIDKNTSQKKRLLSRYVKTPMIKLAHRCANDWGNPEKITRILHQHFETIPNCQLLYCFDVTGKQFSGSVTRHGIDMSSLGEERKDRPYFQGLLPYKGMALSAIYLSTADQQPCITALFAIKKDYDLLGFVAADFHINNLPRLTRQPAEQKDIWAQYKGDPSIRSTVFMQQRTHSHFDQRLDRVIYIVYILLRKHGIFHIQIDFSSSRLVIWSIDTPFEFQVLSIDELFSNQITRIYEKQPYPGDALVPEDTIMDVMAQFKLLRQADETIYLRSATLNIINGTVGLTFSCDGYHLMSVKEFLSKDIQFWIGNSLSAQPAWRSSPLLEIA